jgi:GNAT superfamily N-acetyltransferase
MHGRCSAGTLAQRYHGPPGDADRYLAHLLSPRHGHSVAAWTPGGELVGLGHLLWDGEDTEVALLVEDAWQRRGVGAALLRQLITLAVQADRSSVYAVTRASDTAMLRAMRATGLPLEYQRAEGTLVITALLAPQPSPPVLSGPAAAPQG